MRNLLAAGLLVAAACAAGPATPDHRSGEPSPSPTARLLFAGDLMLGRRVAPIVQAEGDELLEGVRFVVSSADVAAANLESPLTDRPHRPDRPYALEASPASAAVVAAAGFDLVSLANNHAGDAGPEGLLDTIDALERAGLLAAGAGPDRASAAAPVEIHANGVRIHILAFDVTGIGLPAGPDRAGVDPYVSGRVEAAVQAAAAEADLVAVSLHGGVEYLGEEDPLLGDLAGDLVGWGADIVWGHGSHVPQPVSTLPTPAGRTAVVATSLGNLLFDQQRPDTQTGLLLEVLASRDGVEAYRVGRASHPDLRPRFDGWDLPTGPAGLLGTGWWALAATPETAPAESIPALGFPHGDVTAAGIGDVTGDGRQDLVVSYRHPFRATEVNRLFPDRDLTDAAGRSAHLGVFDPETFEPRWGAGTLLRPVAELAVCDGSVALAFDGLDDPDVVATGGWVWWDFGFAAAPELPGSGTPGCADLDGDGRSEPVVVDR